jgi:hypothetical protein
MFPPLIFLQFFVTNKFIVLHIMRLWTLHPKYLDARGLVALWRESLLAQAVLAGKTSGYTRHPQLIRFRNHASPLELMGCYLHAIYEEAVRRDYLFNVTKIQSIGYVYRIEATDGQLNFEWGHLKAKLHIRSPVWFPSLELLSRPQAHPLFRIVSGSVSDWEIIKSQSPHKNP